MGETAEDVLVVRCSQVLSKGETEQMEWELTEKFGLKVVVLDARFGEVFRVMKG
jgi:hypothetical protein